MTMVPNSRVRCGTCAFRAGTFPNGCEATLADAMKAVLAREPFLCHESPESAEKEREPCAGWFAAVAAIERANVPVIEVPWKYSHIE